MKCAKRFSDFVCVCAFRDNESMKKKMSTFHEIKLQFSPSVEFCRSSLFYQFFDISKEITISTGILLEFCFVDLELKLVENIIRLLIETKVRFASGSLKPTRLHINTTNTFKMLSLYFATKTDSLHKYTEFGLICIIPNIHYRSTIILQSRNSEPYFATVLVYYMKQ